MITNEEALFGLWLIIFGLFLMNISVFNILKILKIFKKENSELEKNLTKEENYHE